MATVYYIGTSGWQYEDWRGVFYPGDLPKGRWLEFYTTRFRTVELNNSFYHLPSEKAFTSWRDRTPPGFLFAVKASRFITHIKRLRNTEEPLENFLSRARLLGDKLGPILYQLPPGMRRNEELLEGFLKTLPGGLLHTVEFRNASWYHEGVLALLERYNVAFCIHDMQGCESPVVATADFAYVRFHGTLGLYYGSYSDEELEEWAGRLRTIGGRVRAVYVYFNNDVAGYAVKDAANLARMLEGGGG
jgi:uncharacterized protein YecE (DUF72 family)